MAAEIKEKMQVTGSIDSNSSSIVEEWYITGDSLLECGELLRAYRNKTHPDNNYYRVSGISYSKEGATNGKIQVIASVTYSRGGSASPSDNEAEESDSEPVFSFSAGGGTKHVTNATLVKRFAGPTADYVPDPGTLVGWNGENGLNFQVAGVDVPTASIKESWETEMSMSELTTSWRRKIAAATGTCNSSRFKGWERGEVLLVNCSFQGSPNSSDKVKVRFDFAIRLNEPNAQVAKITLGEVEGWQYVWTIQRPHLEGYTPDVLGAYVSQVVSYSDFNSLGL